MRHGVYAYMIAVVISDKLQRQASLTEHVAQHVVGATIAFALVPTVQELYRNQNAGELQ